MADLEFYGREGVRVWTPGLRNGVMLELRSQHVLVGNPERDFVAVEWRALDSVKRTPSNWMTSEAAIRRGVRLVPIGLDVVLRRTEAVAEWLRSSGPWTQRARARLTGAARFHLGPPNAQLGAVRDTLDELRFFLESDVQMRARLSEPKLCRALAAELAAGCLLYPPRSSLVGRDRADIEVAARAAGLVHPRGRPLPGAPLTDREDAVARITANLRRNPYRATVPVPFDAIFSWLDEAYFVDPWPFSAFYR